MPLVLAAGPGARADVEATGLDAITTPGTPVRLRAKFESEGLGAFQPDVRRGKVRFEALGQTPTDLTDNDGIAEATVTPITSGVFPFRAVLLRDDDDDDDDDGPPVAEATLYVVDPARPVAVVDIDGTLSDMGALRALTSAAEAPTFEGAPELLAALARTHQLVYLTARDDHFAQDTRAFLARHAFPPGPVLFNTWGLLDPDARAQLAPGNHGAFKLKRLRLLQDRKLNLTLGIGDSVTDAEAYEGAGLRSCIHIAGDPDRAPREKSFHFARYADLRARLVADGVVAR